MRFVPILGLVLAAAPAAAQTASPDPVAPAAAPGKRAAPVEIRVERQPDPAPGVRRVRIVARPGVDAAEMAIDVAADRGLALTAPASWTVPAVAGAEVVHDVDVRVTGEGEQRIVVTATVRSGEGFEQTEIERFAFRPVPREGAPARRTFARIPTHPGGRTIVEVPAETP